MKFRIKPGDAIRVGRHEMKIEHRPGQGRSLTLDISNGLKGRVRVIRKRKRE